MACHYAIDIAATLRMPYTLRWLLRHIAIRLHIACYAVDIVADG